MGSASCLLNHDGRRKVSLRTAASAILLVLATSNVVTRSGVNGFGSFSVVNTQQQEQQRRRSFSGLYFSGTKKKSSSEDDDENNNIEQQEEGIQDLFAIPAPTGSSGTSTNSSNNGTQNTKATTSASPHRNRPRSTPKNNRGSNRNKKKNNSSSAADSNSRIKDNSGNTRVSSLLPPPPPIDAKTNTKSSKDAPTGDDTVSQGLSSWEEFLGAGGTSSSSSKPAATTSTSAATSNSKKQKEKNESGSERSKNSDRNKTNKFSPNEIDASKDLLPSIADLFPSDLSPGRKSSSNLESSTAASLDANKDGGGNGAATTPSLNGVLPVSDLFYRSVQSMSSDDDAQNDGDNDDEDPSQQRDDEELPFSAEQSDQLTSSLNKIKIRRNGARSKRFAATTTNSNNNNNNSSNGSNNNNNNKSNPNKSTQRKRKLQRRGMEMLVGGVPINADPPQRCVELSYRHDKTVNWKDVITTNSRDFGPMYSAPSVGKLSKQEQGLYCEFFVNSTLKWNVCAKDLRAIVNKNEKGNNNNNNNVSTEKAKADSDSGSEANEKSSGTEGSLSANSTETKMKDALRNRMVGSMKEAFSRASTLEDQKNQPRSVDSNAELSGELVFSIGVSREELEESSGDSQTAKSVLQRVLARGISTSSQCTGFDVGFSKLKLSDLEDGSTTISAEFVLTIENNESMSFAEVKKKGNEINSSLAQAMDDGDMQLAMAAAAKKEMAWSEEFRNRIVEEFLFDDDDGDGPLDGNSAVGESLASKSATSNGNLQQQQVEAKPNLESTIDSLLNDLNYEVQGFKNDDKDVPFGMPGSPVYSNDDIFLGEGNDGVFWNYASENAARAPYQGRLGLRMVDAVTEKAKQRHPRVIAIGDVHGCIDELQDLLRECDYRPGDLVVFLGDLVSKGPDSMAVVQMAREIGAIGVRGNHDFEVVRWHQAIMSGVDPPVVGSEHFHIANCLTKADMKWMYSLPWYISSPDLGALFVHAGFVSGIRLAKQNPRLLMNMRSILPDGTVTSKFFNNWPWARLWDGPQTVLFGHDADRGLQQYEHAIGLDTGCVYGGRLTACILPEKRLVSVNARREYFKYRRKHYD